MPPKVKISKKDIINGAIELIREVGVDAFCARSLSKKLGVSTQPIFSNFSGMDELLRAVIEEAREISQRHTERVMESGIYHPYKASGMAYISFARRERELFRLLFMTKGARSDDFVGYEQIIETMRCALGVDHSTAKEIHFQMWSFVHGIATMINTDYLELDDESISKMLTNIYEGLKFRYNIGSAHIDK